MTGHAIQGRAAKIQCSRCGHSYSIRSMWCNPGTLKWTCENFGACIRRARKAGRL